MLLFSGILFIYSCGSDDEPMANELTKWEGAFVSF
ncbi:MAG: hypothetical protein ACJAS3_003535 [Roseivirga sp.]|jgi:hypothetical protein